MASVFRLVLQVEVKEIHFHLSFGQFSQPVSHSYTWDQETSTRVHVIHTLCVPSWWYSASLQMIQGWSDPTQNRSKPLDGSHENRCYRSQVYFMPDSHERTLLSLQGAGQVRSWGSRTIWNWCTRNQSAIHIMVRKIIFKFSTCITVGSFTGCLDAKLEHSDFLIRHYCTGISAQDLLSLIEFS